MSDYSNVCRYCGKIISKEETLKSYYGYDVCSESCGEAIDKEEYDSLPDNPDETVRRGHLTYKDDADSFGINDNKVRRNR